MMERLTERHYVKEHGYYMKCTEDCYLEDTACGDCQKLDKLVDRLGAYEDTGLTPGEVAKYKKFEDEAVSKGVPFSRIVELMNADKDGRLVVLPCRENTKIWRISYRLNGKHEVEQKYFNLTFFRPEDFGKSIFLTREEAEQALKEAKKDG